MSVKPQKKMVLKFNFSPSFILVNHVAIQMTYSPDELPRIYNPPSYNGIVI